MIPAQFDYVRANTIDEALALLAQNEDAKILAGGHSLLPAMKLRLAMPSLLVDIGRIKDLAYIREENGGIVIGAATTHYQIESSDLLKTICPLLPQCAGHIGDVQVRNKGTIGGSVAHADPAGDWPAAMIALNAEMIIASKSGERSVKADDFFLDLMTTAIEAGEILREIRVSKAGGADRSVIRENASSGVRICRGGSGCKSLTDQRWQMRTGQHRHHRRGRQSLPAQRS
jgi:carbon-monoxide dehydrogenase medium subunit